MYLTFFGLNEKPFAITPDPRYLFLSDRHSEALAHLVYGVNEAGGFIQLTGEVGTGKTTVIRSLLAQAPKNAEIALILNPRMAAPEFLLTICEELGIGVPDYAVASVKELVDILNRYLLRAHAEGRRVVLVVDEAQNLAPEVLEQVRLLTNLETETQKLLQIILIGQPELRDILGRTELRQLAQRITARYHLDPLSRPETAAYVRHRLRVAGVSGEIFTDSALSEMHKRSGGIPRLINIISDRALLGAYTQEQHRVDAGLVRNAAVEVFGKRSTPTWLPWSAATALVALAALAVWLLLGRNPDSTATVATSKTEAAVTTATVIPPVAPEDASADAGVSTPKPVALAALLDTSIGQATSDAAWARLFELWGAKFAAGGNACLQASRQLRLGCLTQRGTLAQLRLLNRPAVLEIVDRAGVRQFLVLRSIENEHVGVDIGTRSERVSIAELSQVWYGDYSALWQSPAGTQPLSFGMRDARVQLLRQSLQRVAGTNSTTPGSLLYDAALARQVRQFQQQQRLNPDGVAGLQTLLALDAALGGDDPPRLLPSKSG